jgi:hypothetical protein
MAEVEIIPIPESLDDAVTVLYNFLTDEAKDQIRKKMPNVHFGSGMQVRNNWGLWQGSVLAKWFNERGIFHADDMSGLIFTALEKKVREENFNFDEEAKVYWRYWVIDYPEPGYDLYKNTISFLNKKLGQEMTIEEFLKDRSQKLGPKKR